VILLDANLLIYAHVSSMPQHRLAVTWLDTQLNAEAIVALPWQSLLTFVRLVTNPRIFERPSSIESAWDQVESWLDCPVVRIPVAGDQHHQILTRLIRTSVDRSNLIPDAHLAALAIENGFLLCSADRDFSRFPELRWENPLDTV
jgi:toxin-antitoxin system PIN domain toxin